MRAPSWRPWRRPTSPISSSCWSQTQRVQLVEALGPAFRPEVLSELDETVRDQLLPALPKDVLAKAVAELETDDAAYLLENLAEPVRQEILAQMPSGRSRRTRAQPGISRGYRRPSHADGLRGGAAVLDRGARHRPHARGRRPAGDLLRHLRRRSHLSRARQPGSQPAVAHQAARAGRHHHGRGARRWCWRPPTRRRWRASSSATI